MSSIAKPQRRSLGTLIGGASYGRAFRRLEPALDADAAKYLAAVEAADKQVLQDGVKRAVSAFVRACKADGNWDAIKASCILCGARTLAGALVPLRGPAPTNNGFVSGDYSRTDGITGDGSSYLLSGLGYNEIASDDEHLAVYLTSLPSGGENFIGGGTLSPLCLSRMAFAGATPTRRFNVQDGSSSQLASNFAVGFAGVSRQSSISFLARSNGAGTTFSASSSARSTTSTEYGIFFANYSDSAAAGMTTGAIAFYSIGESVDLAALGTAVSTLVSEIGAAV